MKSLTRATGFTIAALAACAGARAELLIETVPVGAPDNAGELAGAGAGALGFGPDRVCGAVGYRYSIGKFEVTTDQYVAFLNAVATTDTYSLYNPAMWSNTYGCKIQRSGSAGSYTYSVASNWASRPVNYLSWGDAARFCNWLHNGQPAGIQGPGTTEDGSYLLNGATSQEALMAVVRAPGATWAIPTEDEWYKAAYHKGDDAPGYWDYPTTSDSPPGNDVIFPDPGNNANYYQAGYTPGGPYWRTPIGEFENSASPWGTFDQGGNVAEFTETIFSDLARVWRGGSFQGDSFLHAAQRDGTIPPKEDYNFGLRVVYVPEPGSLSLLAVSGWIALCRRKRRTVTS